MNPAAILLVLALLAATSLSAAAQSLRVQSGEHRNFTRLVVPWPETKGWSARRDAQSLTVTLEGHEGGFDTSKVFERVPKSRVAAIEGGKGALNVRINCDCDVAAFPNGRGYIVIDVADPGRSLVPPLEVAVAAVAPAPTLVAVPEPIPIPLPWTARHLQDRQPSEQYRVPTKSAANPMDPLALSLQETVQLEILNDMHDRLAREVGAATTRGLLKPSVDAPLLQPPVKNSSKTSIAPSVTSERPLPTEITSSPNLRITTSRDVPEHATQADALSISSGLVCPADDVVNLHEWGQTDDFAAQIGRHRNALYGEFDRLDPDIALDMARSYLFFGFGAEASQALHLHPDGIGANPLLSDIAEIMERGHLRDPKTLSVYTDCDSGIALWALLSMRKIPDGTLVNKAAALRALNKLPLHLRQFLAPSLSNRLIGFGDEKGAAAAMRSIERSPERIGPDGTLAQANIALNNDQPEKAVAKLEEVIDANVALSPEALLALVDGRLAENQPISPETALLVEAYSYELRGSELGPSLRRAHVLSLTRSGQFDKAFAELRVLVGTDLSPESLSLRGQTIADLTETASDVVFLDHVFEQANAELKHLSATTTLAVARRVLGLGFAEEAEKILLGLPEEPAFPGAHLLAAEIALAMNQPHQALADLSGAEGPQAELLRAKAKDMAGETSEAAALYAKANKPEAAVQTAWLSDDWASLTPENNPVFGPIAELAIARPPIGEQPEGMLARTSAAVNESQSAREAISALLSAPDVQIAESEEAASGSE